MFEVTGPGNKILLDYKNTVAYALNAVVTQTGDFVPRDILKATLEAADFHVHYPEIVFKAGEFTMGDVRSHLKVTDTHKNFIEGFIAYTKEGIPVVKIKSKLYIKMSSMSKKNITPRFFATECFKNGFAPASDHDESVATEYSNILNSFLKYKTTIIDGYQAAIGMHSACYQDHCKAVCGDCDITSEALEKILKRFRGKDLPVETIEGLKEKWVEKFENLSPKLSIIQE